MGRGWDRRHRVIGAGGDVRGTPTYHCSSAPGTVLPHGRPMGERSFFAATRKENPSMVCVWSHRRVGWVPNHKKKAEHFTHRSWLRSVLEAPRAASKSSEPRADSSPGAGLCRRALAALAPLPHHPCGASGTPAQPCPRGRGMRRHNDSTSDRRPRPPGGIRTWEAEVELPPAAAMP